MKPTVSQLRSQGFKVGLINVRNNPKAGFDAGVRRLPTSVYRENGKEIRRVVGQLSDGRLKDLCRGL